MSEFYDTHAHLDFPDFAEDLPGVLTRARAAGITRIVCVGTDLESSRRAIALAEGDPGLYAAVGWHPNHVSSAPADVRPALRELARHPKVVAIGETGLDYYHLPSARGGTAEEDEADKRRQYAAFVQHLELAVELGLNCIVHQRQSLEDTIAAVAPFAGRVRGQFHCFGGDVASMRRILEMGSLVSYTGIITFKNAASVRETLAATPLGSFMLETDAPYLAPVPHRGRRCEPAHVRETATLAAEVKGVSLEELSVATCATAREFFGRMQA